MVRAFTDGRQVPKLIFTESSLELSGFLGNQKVIMKPKMGFYGENTWVFTLDMGRLPGSLRIPTNQPRRSTYALRQRGISWGSLKNLVLNLLREALSLQLHLAQDSNSHDYLTPFRPIDRPIE
jgi:hypothetical protein